MEHARRIVMFNWVTADGYFAGPDGNLDWVVPDAEQAKAAAEDIPNFDTVLFGRRTYELFEGFWRYAVVDASGTVPDPHHPGRQSSEHGAIAIAIAPWTSTGFHEDGMAFDRPGRATIVVARQPDGRWLGVHSHMSLARGVPQDSHGKRPVKTW